MRPPPPPRRSASGFQKGMVIAGRVKGVFLLVTTLALVAASVLIAPWIRKPLVEQGIEPTGLTAAYLDMPWLALLLSLPALATCVPLLRGAARPVFWMTVSTLLLVPPLGFFLWGAVGALASIYEKALDF